MFGRLLVISSELLSLSFVVKLLARVMPRATVDYDMCPRALLDSCNYWRDVNRGKHAATPQNL